MWWQGTFIKKSKQTWCVGKQKVWKISKKWCKNVRNLKRDFGRGNQHYPHTPTSSEPRLNHSPSTCSSRALNSTVSLTTLFPLGCEPLCALAPHTLKLCNMDLFQVSSFCILFSTVGHWSLSVPWSPRLCNLQLFTHSLTLLLSMKHGSLRQVSSYNSVPCVYTKMAAEYPDDGKHG